MAAVNLPLKEFIEQEEREIDKLVAGSQLIQTQLGPIEINYRDSNKVPISNIQAKSRAPTLLMIHGGMGGQDQAVMLFEPFFGLGCNLLAISRPGYGNTPLLENKTAEQQADLIAALLDVLALDAVVVIGLSAAGPSLYQLAIRHPSRVKALIAINCISMKYQLRKSAPIISQIVFSEPFTWVLNNLLKLAPKTATSLLLRTNSLLNKEQIQAEAAQITATTDKFKYIIRLCRSILNYDNSRKTGVENDIEQGHYLNPLHLEQIICPALIIHATADAVVLFYDSVYSAAKIPHAEHLWIEGGSHFSFWLNNNAPAIQQRAKEFLLACLK
ncbi:alpha/beta fold family hydrolase [Legionella beliardensis]|uniref:Alpha/beta fold family hydrolase n=1 Tax=Legionella beliardensis TaxID=91822 RepID=A0A378I4Y6_9GAMM|nr:alpha/beta hydrolase [Legionella beliardensis]STX27564.1 alpha/beta fold family hydrolase [Legionella beliardensis]